MSSSSSASSPREKRARRVLADHDYLARATDEVADAMGAMEVTDGDNNDDDDGGRGKEEGASAAVAQEADLYQESGVDLGFDALMDLEVKKKDSVFFFNDVW